MTRHEKPTTKVDELREALAKRRGVESPKETEEKLLRVMAEFENYKKRTARELEERMRYANEKLLADIIPAIDDFDRVLDHIPEDASDDVKKIAEGVDLARRSLVAFLEKFGLQEIEAVGQLFDPHLHEALTTASSDTVAEHVVMAVHRKGYRLGARLLRPSLVTVSKGKE